MTQVEALEGACTLGQGQLEGLPAIAQGEGELMTHALRGEAGGAQLL